METETKLTWDEYENLSDEKKVDAIMGAIEQGTGNYKGEAYNVRWDHVIHAQRIEDQHNARLTIKPIKEWIEENEDWIIGWFHQNIEEKEQ